MNVHAHLPPVYIWNIRMSMVCRVSIELCYSHKYTFYEKDLHRNCCLVKYIVRFCLDTFAN